MAHHFGSKEEFDPPDGGRWRGVLDERRQGMCASWRPVRPLTIRDLSWF